MKTAEELTVADVVDGTAIPVEQWKGNCYAVACAILRAKLVNGRPAYGHWLGPVHPRSPFARRGGGRPVIVRHGWVVLQTRLQSAPRHPKVLDPTRWVFEHVAPYLFVGEPPDGMDVTPCSTCGLLAEEHDGGSSYVVEDACDAFTILPWPYDEGGDQWRSATQRPMPERGGEPVVRFTLATRIRTRLQLPDRPTRSQLHWLANLPYGLLGRDAWAVCVALDAAGCRAFVPLDTWIRADAERGL